MGPPPPYELALKFLNGRGTVSIINRLQIVLLLAWHHDCFLWDVNEPSFNWRAGVSKTDEHCSICEVWGGGNIFAR